LTHPIDDLMPVNIHEAPVGCYLVGFRRAPFGDVCCTYGCRMVASLKSFAATGLFDAAWDISNPNGYYDAAHNKGNKVAPGEQDTKDI
jgi:hypothetical protein